MVSLLGERERRLAGGVRPADDDRAHARRELLARDVDRVGHARALVVLNAGTGRRRYRERSARWSAASQPLYLGRQARRTCP